MTMEPTMNELVGKTIGSMAIGPDEALLVFGTDAGNIAYETHGECCSQTWFADILGVDALLGGTVAQVEDVDVPWVDDGRKRDEEDKFYGVRLTTDKGRADIIYRNSSNGYYGGKCGRAARWSTEGLVAITADWSAGVGSEEDRR